MLPHRSLLLLAVTLPLAAGCGTGEAGADEADAAEPAASVLPDIPVGTMCTVQFRRDLLGGTPALPVAPNTNSINGADVSVSGKLVALDDEWVVISTEQRYESWIPRDVVLLVRALRPPRPKPSENDQHHH